MWILPSRGRPEACRALLAAMVARGMRSGGVIGVNADDAALTEYEELPLPAGWRVMRVFAGVVGMAEACRQAFREEPDAPWYGIITDDHGVETDGFELALMQAAGAWGFSSGNDLWHSHADPAVSRMQGAMVIGGDLVRALGYIVPEGFGHLYIDDVWEAIGRQIGNWRVVMGVITAHNHPAKLGRPCCATACAASWRPSPRRS